MQVLNFDSPRGGISLETEKSRTGTTSKLLVTRAGTRDSGNYTCIARNSIGETRKTIQLEVVTVPTMMKELQARNLISNPIV